MKAAVFKEAGVLAVEDVPIPQAGPGQVVIKVSCCGICGSDLHRYAYGLMAPGVVMGHEFAGTVHAVGAGVTDLAVGDRVIRGYKGPLPSRYSAREKGFTADVAGGPGGYAEYTILPAAAVWRIPDNLSDEVASLSEPLSVAVHAVRLSRLKLGDSVAILGMGPIGLLALQAVKQCGPRQIIVSEPVAARRELALALGADVAINPRAVDSVAEVVRLTDGAGPDIVYECAGAKVTLQQSLEMVRQRGQVVLVALCMEPCQVSPLNWVGREVQLQCSYSADRADWQVSLASLSAGRVKGELLISKVVPLFEIQATFQRLLRPSDELQVLVRP
ncbi:MAG: zinc-dependent alcohol dehydrogenase [Chloroflexota bacterium]